MVAFKGDVSDLVHQLLGGVKSGMGYIGASNLDELIEKSEFVKISSSGMKESHAHDINITKESPNYFLSGN
jgi:IMP dehydrogenase